MPEKPFESIKKMKYENVWDAVDKLAKKHGLSPSGLAKLAGLDATTFNKSKRIRPDGKKRWPSLDSINRLLEIFNLSFEQFYALSSGNEEKENGSIPFAKLSEISDFISDNNPVWQKWGKVLFPDFRDALYAIEIDSEAYAPLYRYGTLVVASQNSDIRKADRVIIYLNNSDGIIKEFVRRTPSKLIVTDINLPHAEENIPIADICLINRIVWISQ